MRLRRSVYVYSDTSGILQLDSANSASLHVIYVMVRMKNPVSIAKKITFSNMNYARTHAQMGILGTMRREAVRSVSLTAMT